MKTDYENLKLFETAAVVVAVVGLSLIGTEFYLSLSSSAQTKLADSMQIFDMHEQIASVSSSAIDGVSFVMGTTNDVMDQFALAFEQTFSYPDAVGQPTMKLASAISSYSESFATQYANNNYLAQAQETAFLASSFAPSNQSLATDNLTPTVSGASIDVSPPTTTNNPKQSSYEPPAFLYKLFGN